ncbi:MAG: hypothetical protein ACFFBP_00260 [Promethearchaeota archaeon]
MIMNETEMEVKKVRGFAGLLNNVLASLNENEKFKENFSEINVKILINAKNANFAALIIINEGKLRVESIPNKPADNLKKEKVGWDAYIEMDTQIFLAFAMKRLSLIGMLVKVITRKVKLKGLLKLLVLMKIMKLLSE